MELVPNRVCMLCEENTAILTPHCSAPYRKYMQITFFDHNNKSFQEFEQATAEGSLCVLCTHKIVVSHKFKDLYEGKSTKRTTFKKTRLACLLCETKDADLVETDANPNNFIENVKSFMDSSFRPRPYLQCAVCFDCLFYLNIWCEVQSNIRKTISAGEIVLISEKLSNGYGETPKKIQPKTITRTPSSSRSSSKKDKENIIPESSLGSQSVDQPPLEMPPQKSTPSTSRGVSAKAVSKKKNIQHRSKNEERFSAFLQRSLNKLQPVQKISGITWPETIVKDKKMFLNIPYVLISKECDQVNIEKEESDVIKVSPIQSPKQKIQPRGTPFRKPKLPDNNSQQDGTRRSSRLDKPIEVIELSDTESETRNGKSKKTSRNSSNGDNPYKRTFVSFKQRRGVRNNKVNTPSSHKTEIKNTMSNSFLNLVATTGKEGNFVCQFCDKMFKKRCDYKVHELWHDKQETVVINVLRQNLPTRTKASNFNRDKKKNLTSHEEMNKLLQKYLPDALSDEDAEFTHTKEIDNIIENLDSLDKQDEGEKEGSQQEQGLENEKSQNGHPDSEETNTEVESKEGSAGSLAEGDSAAENEEGYNCEVSQKNSETKNENDIKLVADEIHMDEDLTYTEKSESNKEKSVGEEKETPEENNVENVTDRDFSLQSEQEYEVANSSIAEDSQDYEEQDDTDKTDDIDEVCDINNSLSLEKTLAAIHGESNDSTVKQNTEELIHEVSAVVEGNDDNNHESNDLTEASVSEGEEVSDDLIETSKAENGEETEDSPKKVNNHDINNDDEETDTQKDSMQPKVRESVVVFNDEKEQNPTEDLNSDDEETQKQKVSGKRKRRESDFVSEDGDEQNSMDFECITSKPKKVRFAMDYQMLNPPELIQDETVSVTIYDKAEKDSDDDNSDDSIELLEQKATTLEMPSSEDGE